MASIWNKISRLWRLAWNFIKGVWNTKYGLKMFRTWRIVSIIGLWNFFRCVIHTLYYRPKFRHFDFEGIPIPIYHMGSINAETYQRVMKSEVASFETRDDDVFVVAYSKSGHHWSYDFINMLLHGNLELHNIGKESVFIEFIIPFAESMEPFDRMGSPRMIFTHFHADALPREVFKKKRKIVRLIRNPKDVAVSAYHHVNAIPGIRNMKWNDFIEEYMDVIEEKRDSNKHLLANKSDWFTYELDCEMKLNNLDHSIVMYYEDLKEDMFSQLKKLAWFLGKTNYEDDFFKQVAEKTCLNYVKKNKTVAFPDLYRKGIIGDWQNHFSMEQNQRFDRIIEEKMSGCPIMEHIRYKPSYSH